MDKEKDYSYLDDPNYEKKRKKRLFILIILVFLTGLMLTVSTYAWFTANRIVSVNSLNVKIDSQGGIEISVDGLNWKTVLNEEELKNATSTYDSSLNQLPDSLEPTSYTGNPLKSVNSKSSYMKLHNSLYSSLYNTEYAWTVWFQLSHTALPRLITLVL